MFVRFVFCLLFVIPFISCSGDTGENSTVSTQNNTNPSESFVFNSYAGLVAEEPCNENTFRSLAHVNETNLDYICLIDDVSGMWSWRSLQNTNSGEFTDTSNPPLAFSSSSTYSYSSEIQQTYSSQKISSSSSKTEIISSSSEKAAWIYLNPSIPYGEIEDYVEKYKTIIIGTQTWMAENIGYKSGCLSFQSEKFPVGVACMYNWDDARTVCPKGWHLPDSTEFAELKKQISDVKQLASSVWNYSYGTWPDTVNFRGTDKYGFSAIPFGYTYEYKGPFWKLSSEGAIASFWTSSFSGTSRLAFTIHSGPSSAGAGFDRAPGTRGLSVRCLKDNL